MLEALCHSPNLHYGLEFAFNTCGIESGIWHLVLLYMAPAGIISSTIPSMHSQNNRELYRVIVFEASFNPIHLVCSLESTIHCRFIGVTVL